MPQSTSRSPSNPRSMSLCGLSPQGPLRCEGIRPTGATYREALARCPWHLSVPSEGRQAGQDSRNGSILSSCGLPASPWATVVGRPGRRLQPLQVAGVCPHELFVAGPLVCIDNFFGLVRQCSGSGEWITGDASFCDGFKPWILP